MSVNIDPTGMPCGDVIVSVSVASALVEGDEQLAEHTIDEK